MKTRLTNSAVSDGFAGCAWTREGAGSNDYAGGESGGGWGAGDSGFAGGDGGAVRVVSHGDAGGLESGWARDADRDAIWGCAATASGEDAGRGAAAAYVFCGCGADGAISSERRRLHCVHEGHRRRGVVSAVPLRREDGRCDVVDGWESAEFAGAVVFGAEITSRICRRGGRGRIRICG